MEEVLPALGNYDKPTNHPTNRTTNRQTWGFLRKLHFQISTTGFGGAINFSQNFPWNTLIFERPSARNRLHRYVGTYIGTACRLWDSSPSNNHQPSNIISQWNIYILIMKSCNRARLQQHHVIGERKISILYGVYSITFSLLRYNMCTFITYKKIFFSHCI